MRIFRDRCGHISTDRDVRTIGYLGGYLYLVPHVWVEIQVCLLFS